MMRRLLPLVLGLTLVLTGGVLQAGTDQTPAPLGRRIDPSALAKLRPEPPRINIPCSNPPCYTPAQCPKWAGARYGTAKSVALVLVQLDSVRTGGSIDTTFAVGTASLIGAPNYLMTANHVLTASPGRTLSAVTVFFNYESAGCPAAPGCTDPPTNAQPAPGAPTFVPARDIYPVTNILVRNVACDFAVFSTGKNSNIQYPRANQPLLVIEQACPVRTDSVYIPQHPLGIPKQIDQDIVVDSVDCEWTHRVDTFGGSSGSPVVRKFNNKCVGVHLGSNGTAAAPVCPNRFVSTCFMWPSIRDYTGENPAVPIFVQSLEIGSQRDGIMLAWQLSGEARDALDGVRVQRSDNAAGPFVDRGNALLDPQLAMSFVDPDVQTGHSYWYRLALAAKDGTVSFAGPLWVQAIDWTQARTGLLAVSEPNGGGDVLLRYRIGTGRVPVKLEVYDVSGRLVRRFVESNKDTGEYARAWDRRDVNGRRVQRGVYVVQLQAGASRDSRKLVLVRD